MVQASNMPKTLICEGERFGFIEASFFLHEKGTTIMK